VHATLSATVQTWRRHWQRPPKRVSVARTTSASAPGQAPPRPHPYLHATRDGARRAQVFLAGATGRLGARILRALLAADPDLRVRAGARDPARAQAMLASAAGLGLLPANAARRVSVVAVDLTDAGAIGAALGGASRVVQAIGAPEAEAFNFAAPKRIGAARCRGGGRWSPVEIE